jgi:hypothetical protein
MPVLRLAQRLTLAIFGADFLTMLAMNCLRLRPSATPWIFFPATALFFTLSRSCCSVELQPRLSPAYVRRLICAAIAFGGLCAAVRWAYVAEPFRHQISAAVGDDLWHIQELNSLVNSPRYPAGSSFVPANYLSFYYASWMPAVALYFALPFHFFTLSTALFAVNALYDLLLPLTLLGIALPLAKSRRQMNWAIYLVALWSGVQSLYSVQQPFHDDSWPLRDLFGLNLQFSNFATLMIWVIHHLCSAVALLLADSIWRGGREFRRVAFCSVLLAFSVNSSAFVVLGAAPLLLFLLIRESRREMWPAVACLGLAGALAAPLLWIYLRKPEGIGFQMPLHHGHWMHLPNWLALPAIDWRHGFASGLALFLILLIVQFFFVPWFIARGWGVLTRSDRALSAISVAYLLSTYCVGFTGANNYCMRGAIVPTIVLCWIASAHLPHPGSIAGIFLIAGSIGTWQTLEYQLVRSAALYLKPPPYLADSSALLTLNQDRSRTTIDLATVPGVRCYPAELPYYVQKMPLEPWPVVTQPDKELQTLGPAGPWSWQRR